MPSRYQYQPLTGPVWREPVAAGLSWLPAGPPIQPRGLPSVMLALYSASFFAALVGPSYDPASLTWQPQGRHQPARVQAAAPWNDSTSFGAPVYDPQELGWLPTTAWPLRLVVPVRTGSTVLDPSPIAPPTFDPAHLAWQPRDRAMPRGLSSALLGSAVLDPFPRPSVAFDPALFPWTEARAPLARPERRVLGEAVQPFTAALYQPEFLQWLPPDWSRPSRALARAGQTWDTLSPFPIAPPTFDPAHLAWTPSGRAPLQVVVPVRPSSAVLDPLPVVAPAPPVVVPTEPPAGGSGKRHRGRRSQLETVVRLARPTTAPPAVEPVTPPVVAPAAVSPAAPEKPKRPKRTRAPQVVEVGPPPPAPVVLPAPLPLPAAGEIPALVGEDERLWLLLLAAASLL